MWPETSAIIAALAIFFGLQGAWLRSELRHLHSRLDSLGTKVDGLDADVRAVMRHLWERP